jgi:ABC-type oligopeptide transport system ATPase subunit
VGLRDKIKISRHAASMVPSKLNLPVGSDIRVKDAIFALVTKSANDVAAAIAEPLRRHRLCPKNALATRVSDLMEQVGLPPGLADRFPRQLSGGGLREQGAHQEAP